VIIAGFPTIMVNGRPMAYLGSPTSHGGMIISGSENVGGDVVMAEVLAVPTNDWGGGVKPHECR
jgi:uncharacterized Zn-binding protein involved in type VI secretion